MCIFVSVLVVKQLCASHGGRLCPCQYPSLMSECRWLSILAVLVSYFSAKRHGSYKRSRRSHQLQTPTDSRLFHFLKPQVKKGVPSFGNMLLHLFHEEDGSRARLRFCGPMLSGARIANIQSTGWTEPPSSPTWWLTELNYWKKRKKNHIENQEGEKMRPFTHKSDNKAQVIICDEGSLCAFVHLSKLIIRF